MKQLTKAGIITLVAGVSVLATAAPAQAARQDAAIVLSYSYHSQAGILPFG